MAGGEEPTTAVVEGEVMSSTTALAHRGNGSGALQEWTPRFAITVDEAVELVEQKREFMQRVMRSGEHYGPIPGTNTKPVLLKPGAELLLSSMGLRPELVDAALPVEDFTGAQHGGEPFIQYRRACLIYRQVGPALADRILIARAEGSCNSWEKKYRYRQGERSCPECGEHAIIKGKAEYGGGWLCWKKKGGCDSKFADDDVRITKQEVGQIPNPDIADQANTLLKMADKRAMVAATLVATGCSDIFTQDLEDQVDYPAPQDILANGEAEHGQGSPQPAPAKQRTRTTTSTPAGTRAAAAQTILAAEEVGRLVWLATALPKPIPAMKDEQHVLAMLKASPIGGLLSRVKQEHLSQCGQTCPHLLEKAR